MTLPAAATQSEALEPELVTSSMACELCRSPVVSEYFEVNTKTVCPSCTEQLRSSLTGGSGARRFGRASVFGLGAAVLGGGLYYGATVATGYNLGLVAIVIGWMVGTAVSRGADARGGWKYQLLAIALTYLAVAGSLAPDVYEGLARSAANDPAGPSTAGLFVITSLVTAGAPVFVAFESPISGIIFAFAIWEAWRRNKKLELQINGPLAVATQQ